MAEGSVAVTHIVSAHRLVFEDAARIVVRLETGDVLALTLSPDQVANLLRAIVAGGTPLGQTMALVATELGRQPR